MNWPRVGVRALLAIGTTAAVIVGALNLFGTEVFGEGYTALVGGWILIIRDYFEHVKENGE